MCISGNCTKSCERRRSAPAVSGHSFVLVLVLVSLTQVMRPNVSHTPSYQTLYRGASIVHGVRLRNQEFCYKDRLGVCATKPHPLQSTNKTYIARLTGHGSRSDHSMQHPAVPSPTFPLIPPHMLRDFCAGMKVSSRSGTLAAPIYGSNTRTPILTILLLIRLVLRGTTFVLFPGRRMVTTSMNRRASSSTSSTAMMLR